MTISALRRRWLLRATAGAGCLLLGLSATPAGAASALVMSDRSGDANGVNDSGEGAVGDVAGGVSHPQADLRQVRLDPLRTTDGRTYGFSVTFTTEARPAPLATSPRLDTTYSLLMQPTPDCRLSVRYTATSAIAGSGALQLGNSCSIQHREVPLRSVRSGRTVRVEVPYRVAPRQLQAGERVEQHYASTTAATRMLDTIYSRGLFTLPR